MSDPTSDPQHPVDDLVERLRDIARFLASKGHTNAIYCVRGADRISRLEVDLKAAGGGWRTDVENAPNNYVLVWSEELEGTFGVVTARRDPDLGWQSEEVNFEPYEDTDYESDDEDATITVDPAPTHWMPLPPAPATTSVSEGSLVLGGEGSSNASLAAQGTTALLPPSAEPSDRCEVCAQAKVLGLFYCEHPPEEHARVAVAAIMAKHGPKMRDALRAFLSAAPASPAEQSARPRETEKTTPKRSSTETEGL